MIEKVKKDPFDALPPEFVDAAKAMQIPELNERISTIAKGEVENLAAKEADDALADAKKVAKDLGAPYSEATKMNKLKIKYLHMQLKAKGGK